MNKKLIDFTIGADPEFTIVDHNDLVISASQYIRENDEEFGADGNGTTFEIRPSPSKNPLQLINNIRDIFVRQSVICPKLIKYKWVAETMVKGYPNGGHVHFGIPNRRINHTDAIVHLDNYVGMVSLLLEPNSQAIKRRVDCGYGRMGDMRFQSWGFEYRPMSTWLSSPYIAASMLCLSKMVMYETLNNPGFEWHDLVTMNDFLDVDRKVILNKFVKIWEDITKMHLYQVYKPYIDFIYFLVKKEWTWISSAGMKESWGIINIKNIVNNKIPIDLIWNRYNLDK